ncbi:MAG: phosphatase PAP2 family protein [Acidithiobacillus sp.]|nr:phosphatase PAP2 family protein [Acidithiobacillus sp.]
MRRKICLCLCTVLTSLAGTGLASAENLAWMATYPYGQAPSPKLIAAGLAPASYDQPAATLPSRTSSQSAITKSHSIVPQSSSVPPWWNQPLEQELQSSPHALLPSPESLSLPSAKKPWPWYDTPLGVLGIGVVATGVTFAFDHGINQYAETHISYNVRKHIALNFADVITDSAAIFAGTTWFQSPWASAKLAHTSSVALTAAAATTVEVFALKYAFGRTRPSGPNSNSMSFHPFSSRYTLFDTSFIFRGGTGNTASFPSGHTAIAFALITPYAQNYHLPWLYSLPVLVGISRIIAVNGHWASDVVAGGFVGWLTADLTNRLFPNSNYGFMLFGDGVGFYGKF